MQNFEIMSKKSLEMARAVADGKQVTQVNFIPLEIVDLKNADKFTAPEW
jgi:hypothetical protein